MKKTTAVFLSLIMLLSLASCTVTVDTTESVESSNSQTNSGESIDKDYPGGGVTLGGLKVGLPNSTWSGEYSALTGGCLYKVGHFSGKDPTVKFFIDEKSLAESISFSNSFYEAEAGSDFTLKIGDYSFSGNRTYITDSKMTATVDRLYYEIGENRTLRFQVFVKLGDIDGIEKDDPELETIITSIIELNDLSGAASADPDESGNIAKGEDSSFNWSLSKDGTLSITVTGSDFYGYGNSEDYPWYPYMDKIKKVVLPEGITQIPSLAFEDCKNLTEVNIPSSVTRLHISCFNNCASLEKIELPEGLKEADYFVFSGCTSLTEVTIPGNLSVINNYDFSGCTSLKTVKISKGVQSLGYDVFDGCSSLTTLYLPKSVTLIDLASFRDTAIKDIYYEGTESDFAAIDIKDGNSELSAATVHYQSYDQ